MKVVTRFEVGSSFEVEVSISFKKCQDGIVSLRFILALRLRLLKTIIIIIVLILHSNFICLRIGTCSNMFPLVTE